MKKSHPSTVSETRPGRQSKMKGLVIWDTAFGTWTRLPYDSEKIFETTFGMILEFVA
jgi:hypothetical protein